MNMCVEAFKIAKAKVKASGTLPVHTGKVRVWLRDERGQAHILKPEVTQEEAEYWLNRACELS